MKYKNRLLLFIIPLLGVFIHINTAKAQTCSCAGAPLVSSQSTGASAQGNLLFGLTYEFHEIAEIYSGTRKLENRNQSRNTQSILLEAHYGLTDRLSISGTFSYVEKERTTGLQFPAGGTTVNTNGLGDGILMARYTIIQQSLWEPFHLAIGAGGKIPFGTTSVTNNGFAMTPDMQPGTGAWDGVFWSHLSYSLLPRTTTNLSLITTYRQTGANDRFDEQDRYRFGNELVTNMNVSNQLIGGLSYIITMRYRYTTSDRLNGVVQPNTGGKWLSVVPSLNYSFNDTISMRVTSQIPLWQELNGTQPTTSYTLSASLFLNFNQPSDSFGYGLPQ